MADVKWLGDTSFNNKDKHGEELVASYTHNANIELPPQSVDWSTGVVTFASPHGIVSKETIIICPNYKDSSNMMRDIRSIPIEWVTQSYRMALVPVTDTTCKVVRDNDATNAGIAVNLTSTDNNNNVDITKFHFERRVPWSIKNLSPMKRMKVTALGFVESHRYRYPRVCYTSTNGSEYWSGVLPIFNHPIPGNGTRSAGVWGYQEWLIDVVTSNFISILPIGFFEARRTGYNTTVVDRGHEAITAFSNVAVSNPIKDGITGIETLTADAHMANGSVVNIYAMGGKMNG